MGSLIRTAALRGYDDLVRELGGDPESLLTRFGIPADAPQRDDDFIPVGAFIRLLEASAEDLNCPDFGLRLSRFQGLDILGPIAVIARNAQTVLGGFEAIARYLYVHSPALRLTVRRASARSDVQCFYEVTEPGVPHPTQSYELSMGIGTKILRLLGGPHAHPRAVSFMHPQLASQDAYRVHLGCPARFDQTWSGFELSSDIADKVIGTADPETQRIATKYLESTYLPSTAALSERVAELTRRLLPTGQCSADAIADQLALHPRTLQRQLAAEGVTCHDIIDDERKALAARYLAVPGLHLNQIAGLIGYSEQSALNRSCRRWFGQTPRQYRTNAQTLSRSR
ncbi:AraC family transcriptional regulator [Mycolicibacterium sp. 120270]|uniref:AraC family transcriptional regulator n=1 Tax=Mycolicibacterium sp. 120270 TaxID=3090600 RepID=UPI00299E65DC|nr:AraC family transcriptional regulator [Mycolicibacterium sp. 120270]MDX1883268.1 AraC family transcriptional regulator [Mycolicibacterium sp. 120270]